MTPERPEGGTAALAPDRRAQAETLRVLLVAGMALLVAAAFASVLLQDAWRGVEPYLIMIAGHAVALAVLSTGRLTSARLRTAVAIHATLYLLTVVYAMYLYGGIRSPAGFILPPIVLLVGLTWSGRAAIVTASVASLAALGLVFLEEGGLLPAASAPGSRALWVVATTALVITSVILALALRTIDGARAKSAAAERDRRRLEEHVARMHQLEIVGRLAAGIAHDFNNLLTVILGQASLQTRSADPKVVAGARQIEEAALRAAALNQKLLAIGRQQRIEPRELELNGVVRGLEGLMGRGAAGHGRLRFELSSEPLPLTADPTQIEQILLNLVGNAQDATRDGDSIVVRTRRAGPAELAALPGWRGARPFAAAIEVADSGEGMSREAKARLFEPFFTTKPPGKGTGLGLASVFGIVEQNGGAIAVESETGRGTTFSVYLPLGAAPGSAIGPS